MEIVHESTHEPMQRLSPPPSKERTFDDVTSLLPTLAQSSEDENESMIDNRVPPP